MRGWALQTNGLVANAGLFTAAATATIVLGMAVGWIRPRAAAWAGAVAALVAMGFLALGWHAGDPTIVDCEWIPELGSRLHLALDPLAAPLVVFTLGLAAPILFFTGGYLPPHLTEHGRGIREQARFCTLMLGFALAMVLLLTAQDLLVMFVALELTALASFFLIEFDRDPSARRAAATALVVTVASSLLFLVGALLITKELGTTHLPELRARAPGPVPAIAAICLSLGVLGKSAQVPLHFWLPRAMVAPTPVSAYLHSAALVAAGVFTLQRVRTLFSDVPELLSALHYIGFVSVAVGGTLALLSDELKRILAYSTIAQYGYALVLIAAGADEGIAGAPLFLVAHGVCKCALFLTAGAITSATGIERLSRAGGLGRSMPVLAAASAIAAAGLAGLPATIGYHKDELLFAAALHRGTASAILETIAVGVTLAYTARFWFGLFAGPARGDLRRPQGTLVLPIAFLAILTLAGGLWTHPLEHAFSRAGRVIADRSIDLNLAHAFGWRTETAMSLAAWTGGAVVYATRHVWERRLRWLSERALHWASPAHWAERVAEGSRAASRALYDLERRGVRDRLSAVLLPTAALIVLGLVAHGRLAAPVSSFGPDELPVAAALLVTSGAAFAAGRQGRPVPVVLMLSFVGYGLALTFALSGAPDLALVIVIIETTLTLLFLGLLSQLRKKTLRRLGSPSVPEGHGPWVGLLGAGAMFLLAWFVLGTARDETVASSYLELAPKAHARDVVTAILADFRGLDTAGELTVLAVSVLGAAAIGWERGR